MVCFILCDFYHNKKLFLFLFLFFKENCQEKEVLTWPSPVILSASLKWPDGVKTPNLLPALSLLLGVTGGNVGKAGEFFLFVTWRNSPARKPSRGQESQHFPWVHAHTHTHTHTHTHPICTHKGETIHCGGEDSRGEADTRERESTIEGHRTEKGTTHRWRRTLAVGKEILFSSFKRIIQTTESFKKP